MPIGIPHVLVWSGISTDLVDIPLPPRPNVTVQTYPSLAGTFRSQHSCGLSYDRILFYLAPWVPIFSMHMLGSATWTQPADLQPGFGPIGEAGCTSSYKNNRKMWLTGGRATTCKYVCD